MPRGRTSKTGSGMTDGGTDTAATSRIGRTVKDARQPWRKLDREVAEVKKHWQQDRPRFIALVLGRINTIIDDAPRWMRSLPGNAQEQLLYDLRRAQFEAAVQVDEAYRSATRAAEERGRDAVAAGFEALFEACGSLTPAAVGDLMGSAHPGLAEATTYLLAGGVAEHVSLGKNLRLVRHFTSQSQSPAESLHEELPAAVRLAHAERLPSSGPLFENDFINAVVNTLMGKTASEKDVPFPRSDETGEDVEFADRINPLLPEDSANRTEAGFHEQGRDRVLALAARVRLSGDLRQLLDLYLEDGALFAPGGNKEVAERLGCPANRIGGRKLRLLKKLREAALELLSKRHQSFFNPSF